MDLPSEAPVMTLPDTTLFPQAMLPLYIFEPRYREMLDQVLRTHRVFCVAMRQPGRQREAPSLVAGLGLVRACVRNRNGTSNLILQGLVRVRLSDRVRLRPYRVHRLQPLVSEAVDPDELTALCERVVELVAQRLDQGFQIPVHLLRQVVEGGDSLAKEDLTEALSNYAIKQGIGYLSRLKDPGQLADMVSCTLLSRARQRQTILETLGLEDRLRALVQFLILEIVRHGKKGKE
jgi:Lon protease-like protein